MIIIKHATTVNAHGKQEIKTTAFENDNLKGELLLHLEGNQIIIDKASINDGLRSEIQSQVQYGLIRMALSIAFKIDFISEIKGKGLFNELVYLEQLFVVFKSAEKSPGKANVSEKFIETTAVKNFSDNAKYFLISHGERVETGNIPMMVLEGRFETEETDTSKLNLNSAKSMGLFNIRERFLIGDVFKRTSVFAIANGQMIEVPEKISESIPPKATPYGVSAYNGFVLSHVLVSLHDLKWFELVESDIHKTRTIELDKIALKCPNSILNCMYDFISDAGIINYSTDKISYSVNESAFNSLKAEIGYLKFILQGYNEVFMETTSLAKGEKEYWKDIRRNDDGVSEFLLTYAQNVEPAVFETVADVGFKKMAYLGCGNAIRLIELCKANPASKAIGVEIDPNVAKKARENIAAAGLSGRIEIVEEDISSWVERPQKDVDLVLFIVGMAHDFLKNKERAYAIFWKMKNNLAPNAKMVLEDINIQENNDPWAGMTINKGFEFVHALMGVNLGTREKYVSIFNHFGWHVEFVRGTGLPNAWIYVLKSDVNEDRKTRFELSLEMAATL